MVTRRGYFNGIKTMFKCNFCTSARRVPPVYQPMPEGPEFRVIDLRPYNDCFVEQFDTE